SSLGSGLTFDEWADVYKKIIYWELELDKSRTAEMRDILTMQKKEANNEFSKFIGKNYINWQNDKGNNRVMSHTLMKEKVFPELESGTPTFLLLIDKVRFDQWRILQPVIPQF